MSNTKNFEFAVCHAQTHNRRLAREVALLGMILGLRANQALFILGALSALAALATGGQAGFFILLFSQLILLCAVVSVWLNK